MCVDICIGVHKVFVVFYIGVCGVLKTVCVVLYVVCVRDYVLYVFCGFALFELYMWCCVYMFVCFVFVVCF